VIRTMLRYGRPGSGGRRIRPVSGDLDPAGSAYDVADWVTWIAFAVFAAFTAVGVVPLTPSAPAAAAAAVVSVAAAALLIQRWRPLLLYAAVATAGLVVLADGRSNNIGLFAVYLLEVWCVLTGSR
jgi:hypothetical protein